MLFLAGICKRVTSKLVSEIPHVLQAAKASSDFSTYGDETKSILRRTEDLSATLKENEPEVLAAFVGLRPSRIGGARIERCNINIKGQEKTVVHNYGAGGTGFQAGWGMSLDAINSVDDILEQIQGYRARL